MRERKILLFGPPFLLLDPLHPRETRYYFHPSVTYLGGVDILPPRGRTEDPNTLSLLLQLHETPELSKYIPIPEFTYRRGTPTETSEYLSTFNAAVRPR